MLYKRQAQHLAALLHEPQCQADQLATACSDGSDASLVHIRRGGHQIAADLDQHLQQMLSLLLALVCTMHVWLCCCHSLELSRLTGLRP